MTKSIPPKVKVTHYLHERTYNKLVDMVCKEKQEGNREASQSDIIERAIDNYHMNEEVMAKLMAERVEKQLG